MAKRDPGGGILKAASCAGLELGRGCDKRALSVMGRRRSCRKQVWTEGVRIESWGVPTLRGGKMRRDQPRRPRCGH